MSLGHSMVVFMRMLCCGPGCCKGCCWKRSWSQMCCSARCCLECSEGGQERDGRQNLQSCYDDSKKIPVQLFWTLEEYHSAVVFIYAYIDIYTKIIWSFHQTQLNVSSVLFFSCKSPLFRQEVVKIFLNVVLVILLRFQRTPVQSLSCFVAHSVSICFANQADKVVTMICQTYYLYFLTFFLPQITMKILKFEWRWN